MIACDNHRVEMSFNFQPKATKIYFIDLSTKVLIRYEWQICEIGKDGNCKM